MRKDLLSAILFFALAATATSQITITKTDMPQPGDTLRVSTATDSTGLAMASLTGTGLTWDYSNLTPASQTIDTFLSPGSTSAIDQLVFNNSFFYPAYKATVAQSTPNPPSVVGVTVANVVTFYKAQTANYENVGYAATINGLPTPVTDDTIDVVYKFPMVYGNSDSCHSSSHQSIPLLGYYGQNQFRVNYVEGAGTLITPFGTFSALKVKTLLYASDSLYIDTFHFGFSVPVPEQIQYKWLANGQGMPLLQINETVVLGSPTYVSTVYRDSARNLNPVPAGITEVNSSFKNVSLYPNPADENTVVNYYLANSSLVKIAIYSVDGRCISPVFSGEQATGNYNLSLNAANLQSGIYLLKMEANGGQEIRKLVVVK